MFSKYDLLTGAERTVTGMCRACGNCRDKAKAECRWNGELKPEPVTLDDGSEGWYCEGLVA